MKKRTSLLLTVLAIVVAGVVGGLGATGRLPLPGVSQQETVEQLNTHGASMLATKTVHKHAPLPVPRQAKPTFTTDAYTDEFLQAELAASADSSSDATDESQSPVAAAQTTAKQEPPKQVQIDVAAVSQMPLYNGCEVTALSMLLAHAGVQADKDTLAAEVDKDPTPATYDDNGAITGWGDPNVGFVGAISGDGEGYGVYHAPLTRLLEHYLSGRADDFSGGDFARVIDHLRGGRPVVVWTTAHFAPPDSWITWQSPNGQVQATLDEHAVLVVGYDDNAGQLLLNDPLDGTAAKRVDRESFVAAWEAMGKQAVSYS